MACLSERPRSSRAWARPALSTMAARVPFSPSWRISAGTVAGGVQITARSGALARSATLAATGRPASLVYFGLTGWMAPRKPPAIRLCSSVAPRLPGRSEAPISATERGAKSLPRLRTLIAPACALANRLKPANSLDWTAT